MRRAACASVVALATLLSATGWLYLARPHTSLPGPSLYDGIDCGHVK